MKLKKKKKQVEYICQHTPEQFSVKINPKTNKKIAVCIRCGKIYEVNK